ncbi:MAG: hypothetical protein Kow0079_16420 [Vicingaceae bacterium]
MKKILNTIIALTVVVSAVAQKLDRSKKPAPGPAPEIKLGETKKFVLDNGLKVFVVENHKIPKVTFNLELDVDPVLEADAKGYVSASGEMLRRGTTNRSKDQLDSEIDFIGATISTSENGIYATALKKHQDKLLDLMTDILYNPAFSEEELEKVKKQTLSGLKTQKDNPDAIANNVRSVLLYGKNHPYGEIVTEETVENITVDKCKSYYNTYFKPNVSYLAVVGDITFDEAKKLVEKYFSKWEKAEVPSHTYKAPAAPSKTRVAVSHKEGAVQSVVNITYPVDLKPNSPDAIKSRVMNTILGGGSSARLFRNLREAHGFTYGAYSRLERDELVGNFNAFAKVRNAVTDSAVTEFLNEMNKIRNEKVTDEEVQGAINYLTGTFAYGLQNPQTIANFAINIEKYNLPADYYANYLKALAAVTADDVHAMAKKYIKPDNAIILAVGDKNEIADKLKPFSASKEVELYDNYGNEWVEPLKPAPEGMTAANVLDKYIEAKFGMPKGKKLDKKVKKIKDITTKMTASVQGQSLSMVIYKKQPNKFSMVLSMGAMVIQKQVFDGTKGKTSGMQGEKELEGEELTSLKEQAAMFPELNYATSGNTYTLLGIENLDGKDAYKIEIKDKDGDSSYEYYDVASGLKVMSTQTRESEQMGGQITITSKYMDYKDVNGIKMPYKMVQSFGPQELNMEVDAIEINSGLGDEIFAVE